MTTQVRGHAVGGSRRRRGVAFRACSESIAPVSTKAGSVPAVLSEGGQTHAGSRFLRPAMKDRSDD